MLGRSGSLAYEPWPEADERLLVQSTYNLPVQVGRATHTWLCAQAPGCQRWLAWSPGGLRAALQCIAAAPTDPCTSTGGSSPPQQER